MFCGMSKMNKKNTCFYVSQSPIITLINNLPKILCTFYSAILTFISPDPFCIFRELGTNIPDETLNVDVEAVFEFETQIAKVSANIVYSIVL